jgi:hypothetical protein
MYYRRFDMAAQAIHFAIAELSAPMLLGAYLQVEDDRLDSDKSRRSRQNVPLSNRETI